MPKDVELTLPPGCFDDDADRPILPRNREQFLTSLVDYGSQGSQQLRKAVTIRDRAPGLPSCFAGVIDSLDVGRIVMARCPV
jgi:hypothetical protein